jgi:hypothetical protein
MHVRTKYKQICLILVSRSYRIRTAKRAVRAYVNMRISRRPVFALSQQVHGCGGEDKLISTQTP